MYEVSVLVNGRPVEEHSHKGKTFIEARDGTQYTIRFKNNSWTRVLVVTSVDGLDVLTGKRADSESSGYIVNGYGSVEIKGFRADHSTVGAFKFVGKNGSYAKSQGEEGNEGVIGIRVYGEKQQPITITNTPPHIDIWPSLPWYPIPTPRPNWHDRFFCGDITFSSSSGNDIGTCKLSSGSQSSIRQVNCCLTSSTPSFNMGTTWGDKVTDKVVEVSFERGCLDTEFEIFYASKNSLIKAGVKLTKEKEVVVPKAFPSPFATPPKGWKSS